MMKGLKRLAGGGMLLLELRGTRREVGRLAAAAERIADALEAANAHKWPRVVQPNPDMPAVEVTYVDGEYQERIMDIETRLTAAKGLMPTEEEVQAEYEKQYGPEHP